MNIPFSTPVANHGKKVRSSNMELFRIVAMFLVLVVHADYFSLKGPETSDFLTSPFASMTRVFFESLSIGCVDMFILLSGWFGIRPKVKGLAGFIYQCLFFMCGIYVVCLAAGVAPFSPKILFNEVMFKSYWFITAYIALYLLSPVLNAFVQKSSEKELRWFLVCFYSFELIYSWFARSATFFMNGYSTLSFIGLYMLARYLRLYPNKLTQRSGWFDLGVFMGIVVLQAAVLSATTAAGLPTATAWVFSYESPLVVASSAYLLLFFSKLDFQSKLVNVIGKSSFAVYLFHQEPRLCSLYFVPFVRHIYGDYSGIACLGVMFLFLLGVFALAVLVDRIRLRTWNLLGAYLSQWPWFNA